MAMLDQQIEPLDQAVKAEAQRDKMALLLQTQPGVGPITALAYVLTITDIEESSPQVSRKLYRVAHASFRRIQVPTGPSFDNPDSR